MNSESRVQDTPTSPQVSAHQHWGFLLQQTLLFAHYQVKRLRWRGAFGGVMPDGYDPNSIAAQAFLDFFLSDNRLDRPLEEILRELKRLVFKHVNRLHHRKENVILSNAEDLAPVEIDEELFNPIALVPVDPIHHPDSVLLEKESLARFESSKLRFSSFLKRERRLRKVFHLLCDQVEKPRAVARKLKIRRATVSTLRKQLRRRWLSCFDADKGDDVRIPIGASSWLSRAS
jgi:hypothetical protein